MPTFSLRSLAFLLVSAVLVNSLPLSAGQSSGEHLVSRKVTSSRCPNDIRSLTSPDGIVVKITYSTTSDWACKYTISQPWEGKEVVAITPILQRGQKTWDSWRWQAETDALVASGDLVLALQTDGDRPWGVVVPFEGKLYKDTTLWKEQFQGYDRANADTTDFDRCEAFLKRIHENVLKKVVFYAEHGHVILNHLDFQKRVVFDDDMYEIRFQDWLPADTLNWRWDTPLHPAMKNSIGAEISRALPIVDYWGINPHTGRKELREGICAPKQPQDSAWRLIA